MYTLCRSSFFDGAMADAAGGLFEMQEQGARFKKLSLFGSSRQKVACAFDFPMSSWACEFSRNRQRPCAWKRNDVVQPSQAIFPQTKSSFSTWILLNHTPYTILIIFHKHGRQSQGSRQGGGNSRPGARRGRCQERCLELPISRMLLCFWTSHGLR